VNETHEQPTEQPRRAQRETHVFSHFPQVNRRIRGIAFCGALVDMERDLIQRGERPTCETCRELQDGLEDGSF